MVTGETVMAALAALGLIAAIPGWLARRDTKHKEDLEEDIASTDKKVDELDTAFARLTTRLLGHPEDESDRGVLTERGARVEQAEDDIDSLYDQVGSALEQSEENGEAIEHLDAQVTEHAEATREALVRIEDQLESGVKVVPDDLREDGRGSD